MLVLFVLFVLLNVQAWAKGHSRNTDPEYIQIVSEIAALRNQIESKGGEDCQDSTLWGNLAMMLQAQDVKFHEDSARIQPEALSCFDKAIEFMPPSQKTSGLLVVHHRKGILLKMMSRAQEAIEAHQFVYENALSDDDKASSLYYIATVQTMIGEVRTALVTFREAIDLSPYSFGLYIAFVEAHLELNSPVEVLKALYEEMESRVTSFEKEQAAGTIKPRNSVLGEASNVVDGSFYWALFLLGDKLKDYTRAWQYLERAHTLVKDSRPPILNMDKEIAQQENIVSIFKKDFFPDRKRSMIGVKSKVPIFIVGMMRSGSTLTETMLDAHSEIWGMGEDSVFNSNLAELRDSVVKASEIDGPGRTNAPEGESNMPETAKVIRTFGNKIVDLAKNSSKLTNPKSEPAKKSGNVKHVVDKMLFNYRNIGKISWYSFRMCYLICL